MQTVHDDLSCLKSPLITILAGEDCERLSVHSFVLSESQSASLQRLVDGPWKECTDRTVDWSHTDLETIQRVITFLYFKDYKAPDPVERTESSGEAGGPASQESADHNLPEDGPVAPGPPEPEPEPEPTSGRPLTPVTSCVGLPPANIVRQTFAGTFADSEFSYKKYSYAKTLVAHAQVYCFADCHLLEPLKELALQRLSQALRRVDCESAPASDEIAKLAAYVYENTRGDTPYEPLRKVVSQFATINYTSLLHDELEDLICQGGDFTRDVSRKLLRRLGSHRHAMEFDEQASIEALHQLQSRLSENDAKIKELEEELLEASDWSRGLGARGRRRQG